MRNWTPTLVVLTAGFFSGCEGSRPPEPTVVPRGPHHGTTLRLPDAKGFVELVNEPEVRDRRKNEPTAIVAYYLQPDAKSALNPPPSDVSFTIDSGGGDRGRSGAPKSVPLQAEPRSDDPAGASRFASQPGPYPLANLRGWLNAKLDGQPVVVVLQGGR
jgi:hypothetical protein